LATLRIRGSNCNTLPGGSNGHIIRSDNPIITSGPRSQSTSSIKGTGTSDHTLSRRRIALTGSRSTVVKSLWSMSISFLQVFSNAIFRSILIPRFIKKR
jgi:hypothetical protein